MPAPCPRCGAPIEQAGSCRYCRVGTLWEGEASESRPSKLRCPRCDLPELIELQHGPVVVDACLSCQGGWFDVGELDATLEKHKQSGRPPKGALGPSGAEEVRYLRCPRCAGLMSRINYNARSAQSSNSAGAAGHLVVGAGGANYARASGIILDQCLAHGVWVDGGELRRLKAWVLDNGMCATSRAPETRLAKSAGDLAMVAPQDRWTDRLPGRWGQVVDLVMNLLGGSF